MVTLKFTCMYKIEEDEIDQCPEVFKISSLYSLDIDSSTLLVGANCTFGVVLSPYTVLTLMELNLAAAAPE